MMMAQSFVNERIMNLDALSVLRWGLPVRYG